MPISQPQQLQQSSERSYNELVQNFTPPPHPKGVFLQGRLVDLMPLNAQTHGADLFAAHSMDTDGINWIHLPYGPFADLPSYQDWLVMQAQMSDPVFFAIVRKSDGKAVGVASFLRISPTAGSIEVGHIHYSPLLQKTAAGTEAMYLMMQWAFDHGYRRYEWKCNALNQKSRYAAQRLGLSYEGVFRQAAIINGRNRNTAWFAAIDKEWPALNRCFITYLRADNFHADGVPKTALSALTKPLLYKLDNGDFS